MARGRHIAALAFLLAFTPGGVALSAFETLLEIVQPMTTTEGMQIATVTYSAYLTETPLGAYVSFLGSESRLIDQEGQAVNRNAANLTGIRAWAEPKLRGDTLRVFLDLRAFALDPKVICCTENVVLDATRECLLVNAYNSRTAYDWIQKQRLAANYIDVHVLGAKRFAWLAGVTGCKDLGLRRLRP